MKPRPPTRKEQAAAGCGELYEWIEYEAEAGRDPAEYRGYSDPDPRYDLAPLLDEESAAQTRFFAELEHFFNELKTGEIRPDQAT